METIEKAGAQNWVKPVNAKLITSTFGRRLNPIRNTEEFHNGIDIASLVGNPAVAVANGNVLETGDSPTWGKYVKYAVEGGYEIFYAHLSSVSVKVGENVLKGRTIAKTGNTGLSTGPHIHVTIYEDGVETDPIYFFDYKLRADAAEEYKYRGVLPPEGY